MTCRLTYCILRAGKPKFQPVEAAAAGPAAAAAKAVVQELQEPAAVAAAAEPVLAGSS
jgi:hypothetical protein